MKTKIIALILSFLMLVMLTLTACGETSDISAKVIESSEGLLVIEAGSSVGSLADALAALCEAGELTYDGSESEYGYYITSVNGREADASQNEYWAVYTTLGEYDGVEYSNAEYGVYDYNGKSCASASYGASGLPLVEGELYILVIESY